MRVRRRKITVDCDGCRGQHLYSCDSWCDLVRWRSRSFSGCTFSFTRGSHRFALSRKSLSKKYGGSENSGSKENWERIFSRAPDAPVRSCTSSLRTVCLFVAGSIEEGLSNKSSCLSLESIVWSRELKTFVTGNFYNYNLDSRLLTHYSRLTIQISVVAKPKTRVLLLNNNKY